MDQENAMQGLLESAARAGSLIQGRSSLDLFRRGNLMLEVRDQLEAAAASAPLVEGASRILLTMEEWDRLEKLPAEYTLFFSDEEGLNSQEMLDPRRLLGAAQWLSQLVPVLKGHET